MYYNSQYMSFKSIKERIELINLIKDEESKYNNVYFLTQLIKKITLQNSIHYFDLHCIIYNVYGMLCYFDVKECKTSLKLPYYQIMYYIAVISLFGILLMRLYL